MKKRKKIMSMLLIIGSFLLINDVSALEVGRITNQTGATFRKGPGANTEKLGTLSYNDNATINSFSVISSTSGCKEGWYSVNYNGQDGYVCSTYISKSTYTVKVNSNVDLKVRNGAGVNYDVYQSLKDNTHLTLSNVTKKAGNGCTDGWYSLNINTFKDKYTCSTYTDTYNSKSNVIVTNKAGALLKEKVTSTSGIKLIYGKALTLSDKTLYKGTNCSSKYYKVYHNNKEYYVCSSDTLNTNIVGLTNYYDGVNIRKGAGTNYEKTGNIAFNTPVAIVSSTKYTGKSCADGWYKIKWNNDYSYVCSTYVALNNKTIQIKNSSTLNIRKGAGTSYDIIQNVLKDTTLPLESTTKYKGTGCDAGWYKVKINGDAGYVCSKYTNLYVAPSTPDKVEPTKVITKKNTNSGNYYTISNWTYRVNENYAYIRSSSSMYSTLLDTVYLGTELDLIETKSKGNGCSESWYKVKYFGNKTGYICKTYVDKYADVTKSDSSYCQKLKNAGFPESYCPYLSYLHSKHPNWVFKAEKTGTSFLNTINGEAGKNYTQITKSPYIASSAIAEVGGWRTASDAYLGFMLDPRNYLNEKNIFAFENLSFDEGSHTKSAVRAMVDGSYLDTDTYAGYFVSYGKLYNISPVHLAARAKQEGAANKNYDAVSGTVTTKWNKTEGYVCSGYTNITTNKIGIVNYNGTINIRSGAGTNYKIISTSANGDTLILQDETLYPGDGCSGKGWNKVNINGKNGYVCSTLLKFDTPKYKKGTIKTTNYLNIRNGAGTESDIISTAKDGDTFDLLSTKKYMSTGCPSGWYKIKLDGYSLYNKYNFYNIGSYGSNPVLRGLATAAGYVDAQDGTPWDTRAKAIKYGAKFIAEGYINKGQDTMYYQKFNTGPNNYYPKYAHQYMTNILAPASESLSTYRSYTDLNILNQAFVFKIPVYSSMPLQITTHPPVN